MVIVTKPEATDVTMQEEADLGSDWHLPVDGGVVVRRGLAVGCCESQGFRIRNDEGFAA